MEKATKGKAQLKKKKKEKRERSLSARFFSPIPMKYYFLKTNRFRDFVAMLRNLLRYAWMKQQS